jgi:small subunit ribosomal protein S18
MSEEIREMEPAAVPAAPAEGDFERDDSMRGILRDKDGGKRGGRFKKKVCKFCHNKDMVIDYKRSDILEKFLTDRGKILPRRITGTCARHQRIVAQEVKRARMIALLPFVEKFQ